MEEDPNYNPNESDCENCYQQHTTRVCGRCGQVICRACATKHFMWNHETDKFDIPCRRAGSTPKGEQP